MTANALIRETSPYLLQHAHNPVDWHPWGPEALALARDSGKPIHLSIGYAACHWCHVLAHESFEDETTAQLLNEHFVNIKVDREERPDLDRIYQVAQQMLTQRGGGWPLTMFLAHDDQRPFFGGTYFPPEPRHGLPAFREVVVRVAEYYRDHAEELRRQNDALIEAFATLDPQGPAGEVPLDAAPLKACRRDLERTFDRHNGGFGGAPKFPHPASIERLLRDWHATAATPDPDLQALYMTTLTLTRMGEGGLFDHLAGGFSRYSVDARWMIPHFEKMLYDNGALLAVYADAHLATGEPLFARVAGQTADYLIADLQSPEGGFVSSRDADSEGHEGLFYVWDSDAVRAALTPSEYAAFSLRYGLDRTPNFEGRWHLHAFESVAQVADALGQSTTDTQATIDAARAKLLAIRARRIPPTRDDKVLTSWNAIVIRGLARAARALDRPDLAQAATRALDHLRARHWTGERLLATSRDGHAHLAAYLDDYVFLADAILELAQIRWRSDEIAFGTRLLEVVLAHFEDRERGGFFFTADDHEQLFHRSRTFSNDATPSGNGVAASALLRYGYLLGDTRFLAAAERTLRAAWPALARAPQAHVSLINALEEYLDPPQLLILRGASATIGHWQREIGRLYAPLRLIFAIAADAPDLPPALADKAPRGEAVAYFCRGTTCSAPIDSLAALARDLRLALDRAPAASARPARD